MDIANEKKPVDYLAYFTKQLPRDLAALATLRDELEKRQGAMTAVEDALKIKNDAVALRAAAKDELDVARKEAAAIAQESKVRIELTDAREKAADERDSAFEKRNREINADLTARDKALRQREDVVVSAERDLAAREARLSNGGAKLAADTKALDERIKAFQSKVAALNV
jgi:hypothetical protein